MKDFTDQYQHVTGIPLRDSGNKLILKIYKVTGRKLLTRSIRSDTARARSQACAAGVTKTEDREEGGVLLPKCEEPYGVFMNGAVSLWSVALSLALRA